MQICTKRCLRVCSSQTFCQNSLVTYQPCFILFPQPSDHVAVGVDPKTEDLVICGVEKDELDECDVDFPDPELPVSKLPLTVL